MPVPLLPGDPSALLERLRILSEDYRCFPIVGDVPLLAAMVKEDSGIGRIALKGCEAAGFVSGETTLVLYSTAKEMLHSSAKSLDVLIWGESPPRGGCGLPVHRSRRYRLRERPLADGSGGHGRSPAPGTRRPPHGFHCTGGLGPAGSVSPFQQGELACFKKIRAFEEALCGAGITDESRRAFVGQVQAGALHPLDSHFTRSEVIPLGVEAAFAASFAERFGPGTEKAVTAFMAETRYLCGAAEAKRYCFLDSPVAREMGITYPLSRAPCPRSPISGVCLRDCRCRRTAHHRPRPDGCPACDRQAGTLDGDDGRTTVCGECRLPGREPVPGNASGLDKATPTPFCMDRRRRSLPHKRIAAMRHRRRVHRPDEALLKLALEAGVRYVVCEGYEAGGHVGQHSTLTLAQMVLDLKRRQPSLFQDCR